MRRMAALVVLAMVALGLAACSVAGSPAMRAAHGPSRASVRITAHSVVVGTRAEASRQFIDAVVSAVDQMALSPNQG
jgi:hypothetical protein